MHDDNCQLVTIYIGILPFTEDTSKGRGIKLFCVLNCLFTPT